MRRAFVAAVVVIVGSFVGCGKGAQAARCPGEFEPGKMTDRQLKAHGIGDIPERSATSLENATWVVNHRAGWIKTNYPDVSSVSVGEGWGVTYSNNQYGDTTYHRRKDYMVVTVVKGKPACPDPDRGRLFVLAEDGLRVPVRFSYLPSKRD